MSIKRIIKSNGNDNNLKFSLGSSINFVDYQQEIDNTVEETKKKLINTIVDYEVRRFTYKSDKETLLSFVFTNSDGSFYYSNFALIGFTPIEFIFNADVVRNSFFIVDYYDTYDSNTQTKIFTSYMTQLINENKVPSYTVSPENENQFCTLNIPKSYLDINTELGYSIIRGYIKLSLYNAKDGKVYLFYNKANETLSTEEKMYFKTTLYLNTMEWKWDLESTQAYQIPISNSYVNKVNNTFTTFDNNKQTYPEGNIFKDGTYETE